ncbi:MAG: branched-chain amino acid transport system permease protein livM, partial [Actinomycetota bacterium]|nr:branched-chain amino acid transport system permease protein livM [Actinomycetota bacterium]
MLERFLPEDRRLRALVIGAATVVLLLVITQLVMPGRGGGRGTPAAVLFDGFVKGCAAAITTVGIVFVYRTMRIINFAVVAMGIAGTILVFELTQFTAVPFPISLTLGIALSALIGTSMALILLRFYNSSRLYLTVVTIIGAGTIAGFSPYVTSLPFFPTRQERTSADDQLSQDPGRLLPFRGLRFHVGSFPFDFGFRHLLALELFVFAMVGLFLFLRYSKAGTAIRALAENSERASLLGIGVGGMSLIVWTIAGALAGAGVIANAAVTSPGAATGIGINVLLG